MAGRPRKPTALKLLQGTAQPCRLNEDEPAYPVGLAPAPSHLSARAKAEYARVGAEMLAVGVLTAVHMASLAAYAQAYDLWCYASEQMNRRGKSYTPKLGTSAGQAGASHWWRMAGEAQERMRKWAAELGITPVSQSKTSATKVKNADADEDERFFGA